MEYIDLNQSPNGKYLLQLMEAAVDICVFFGQVTGQESDIYRDSYGEYVTETADKRTYVTPKIQIDAATSLGRTPYGTSGTVWWVKVTLLNLQTTVFDCSEKRKSARVYRPGQWEQYVLSQGKICREIMNKRMEHSRQQAEAKKEQHRQEEALRFTPIDDSGIF